MEESTKGMSDDELFARIRHVIHSVLGYGLAGSPPELRMSNCVQVFDGRELRVLRRVIEFMNQSSSPLDADWDIRWIGNDAVFRKKGDWDDK